MAVGLSTSMWSGVSGLLANSTKMSTIGNNLANTGTVGFKGSRTDFATLMSSNMGTAAGIKQVGNGVQVGTQVTDYSQGGMESTSSSTDMAVSGNGFFMVKQKSQIGSNGKMLNSGNMTTYYTRAGDFNFDKDGYLVNPQGLAVQGWQVDQDAIDAADASGKALSSTPIMGDIQDIRLDQFSSPAKATTNVTLITQLDSDSEGAFSRSQTDPNYYYAMTESWDGTADPAMAATAYSYQTTVKVYDENGTAHTLTVYYDKISNTGGKEYWEYCVTCDPAEDLRDGITGTETAGLLMTGTMTFSSSGSLENMSAYTLKSGATGGAFNAADWSAAETSSSGYPLFTANFRGASNASFTDQTNAIEISLNFGIRDSNGFTDPTATLDTALGTDPTTLAHFNTATLKTNSKSTTNYGTSSSTVFQSQNGYTSGLLTAVSVDTDGILSGTFSNGQTIELWAVALADFVNLQGLKAMGSNLYSATPDSGDGTTNRANAGTVGSIIGNRLESSNVDMAAEMVSMILTQRSFEASSKTITTVDTMLSEIIQLKR